MRINWKLLSFVMIATTLVTSTVLVANQLGMPLGGSPVAEAHLATPHNTVHSESVIDNTLTAADLAANSVGASEIAANAVGASELQGVTKLLFGQCTFSSSIGVVAGGTVSVVCDISGTDSDDFALATLRTGNGCLDLARAASFGADEVFVQLRNHCTSGQTLGSGSIAVMVYDN